MAAKTYEVPVRERLAFARRPPRVDDVEGVAGVLLFVMCVDNLRERARRCGEFLAQRDVRRQSNCHR